MIQPSEIRLDFDITMLGLEHATLSGDQLLQLMKEYEQEQKQLEMHLEHDRLQDFYAELLRCRF